MRKKAIDILVVTGLSVVIVLLTVRTALFKPPPSNSPTLWSIPSFDLVDHVILFVASMVVGVVLVEVEPILFGWIGSVFSSFLISTVYISLYFWFVLGFREAQSRVPFLFENLFFLVLESVFRITLLDYILVLLGLFLGGFAGHLTGIDRKIESAFM